MFRILVLHLYCFLRLNWNTISQSSVLLLLFCPNVGGTSKTLMILNVCPNALNLSETLLSLNFSARARNAVLSLGNRDTMKKWRDIVSFLLSFTVS